MQGNSHRAEVRLLGTAAAPGVARATAYLLQQGRSLVVRRRVDDPERELARLEAALIATRAEISRLRADVARKLNDSEAAIFDAHLLVLEDEALIGETVREFEESGRNIEGCFQRVSARYIRAFEEIDDEYLRERAVDAADVPDPHALGLRTWVNGVPAGSLAGRGTVGSVRWTYS